MQIRPGPPDPSDMEHVIRPPSLADVPVLETGCPLSLAAPLRPAPGPVEAVVVATDGSLLVVTGAALGPWVPGEAAIILVKQEAGRFACQAAFEAWYPHGAAFRPHAWRRIEARRDARHEAFLAARVNAVGAAPVPGVIVDVSAGGMRLLCSRPVAAASLQVSTVIPPDGPFRCRLVALRAFGEGYAVHLEVHAEDRPAWNRLVSHPPGPA